MRARWPVRQWWRARRSALLQLWGCGLAASLLVTVAAALGFLEPAQAKALDLLQRLQGHRSPSKVVVVAVDDDAFASVGHRQPLPREYLARVIRGLQRSGARVVGVDISLVTPTSPEADAALARAILDFSEGGVSRVVLSETMPPGDSPLAAPAFLGAVLRGRPEVPIDADGVIRRAAFALPSADAGAPEPALPLAIAARLAGMDQGSLSVALAAEKPLGLPRLARGEWEDGSASPVTVRAGQFWRINFIGPAGSFLIIPSNAVAALAEPGAEIARENPLRGSVVLLGGTFREGRDAFPTPVGVVTGVEIHASMAHMLVTRSFIRPSGWMLSLFLQLVIVLAAGLVLVSFPGFVGTALCLGGAFLVGVPASYFTFRRTGYWIDFILPVLAIRFLGHGAGFLERRRFLRSFEQYGSPEAAARVDTHRIRDAQRRDVTVLVATIHDVPRLVEAMPPERLAAHLNQGLEALSRVVFAHHGIVHDLAAEPVLVVAVFGAPLDDRAHALHAAEAAVAMHGALGALNRRWEAERQPALHMTTGIDSGTAFAGRLGAPDRRKYSVVGPPVETAARLARLALELGTSVLISGETHARLGESVQTRERGGITLADRPVGVFELLTVRTEGAAPAARRRPLAALHARYARFRRKRVSSD